MSTQNLVTKGNLYPQHFTFDESEKKIKVSFPANTGVQNAQLVGSTLRLTLQDGTQKDVSLAGLVPAAKADVFLKSVEVQGTNLVFKTGNAANTNDDQTISVAISDLLETKVGNGIQGKGTTAQPISVKVAPNGGLAVDTTGVKVDKATFKPIATVQLTDAFGQEIGYAFLSTERSAG